MPEPPYVPVENVKYFFQVFLTEGIPQRVLETALGMPRDKLDSVSKISGRKNFEMMKRGLALTGPGMAIKLGAAAPLQVAGVIGQIMRNCENLSEAVRHFIRFQNLLLGVSKFSAREDRKGYVMIHTLDYPFVEEEDRRMLHELNLSIPVAHGRKLINAEFSPKEARFSHPQPSYVEIYKDHFRCPLVFNARENAIVIDKSKGDTRIPDAYPQMKSVLVEYAQDLLLILEAGKYFRDDVKRIIGELLPKGVVDIDHVSEKLHMSRWTLTRNLKKEGTTFKSLLEEIRKELAVTYLKNQKPSLAEIAFLLGYSEASAFQRAFKRWTGRTPHQYSQSERKRIYFFRDPKI